jgi:iron(III) transport system permease protein
VIDSRHKRIRAGISWLGILLFALVILPWYRGETSLFAPTLSALTVGLDGRYWLLPNVFLALTLTGYAIFSPGWLRQPLVALVVVAGLVLLLFQGFMIGLQGAEFPLLVALLPAAADGQQGFGWGGFVTSLALLGLLAEILAAQGFCRAERFASTAVVMIIALLSLFVFLPIGKLCLAAFTNPDGSLALSRFIERILSPELWQINCLPGIGTGRCGVVINTLVLGILAALFSTLLGLAMAMLVARSTLPGRRILRAVSILPIITPPFVVGVAIIVLFGRAGIVTGWVAELLNIPPGRWIYGLPGILLAQVLAFAPITFLVLLSALEAINPTLEEAAETLGAKPIALFQTVTWPLLRPGLAAAFLLAFIESLADFGNPIVLGGGYDVLSTKIFFAVVGARYDLGNAATLAIILLALTLVAFYLQMRWLGRKSYVTVTGKSDTGLVAPIPGLLKWSAVGLLVPWVAFTLSVYAIVLVGGFVVDIARWELAPTWKHLITAFSFELNTEGLRLYGSAWNSLQTTLLVSAIAAPLTTAIGILTAWLVVRQEFFGKGAFEFCTMLSFAIPGTVVGVAYIVAFNVPPVDITGTMAILIICFVFRNMPVGMRAGVAALSQIDGNLEEASRTMGGGGWPTLRRVVLPLIRPAIFTAMVYSFVTAMTAVSAVIFLVSARYNMATAYIMGRVENGEYALAIAYSAVLMMVMIFSVGLIQKLVGSRRLGHRSEQPTLQTSTTLEEGV